MNLTKLWVKAFLASRRQGNVTKDAACHADLALKEFENRFEKVYDTCDDDDDQEFLNFKWVKKCS